MSSDPEIRHLAQCLAAAVAVPMVAFATFDALSFPMAASLTFLVLGCVGALWRLVRVHNADISDTAPIPVIRDPIATR